MLTSSPKASQAQQEESMWIRGCGFDQRTSIPNTNDLRKGWRVRPPGWAGAWAVGHGLPRGERAFFPVLGIEAQPFNPL